MKELKKLIIWCLYALLAWGSAIATVGVANVSITKLNLLVPVIMGAYLSIIIYFRKYCERREICFGYCFSIPFALSLVLGSNINMESAERTFTWNIPLNLLYFCLLAGMGMVAVASLLRVLREKHVTKCALKYKSKTIAIVVFLICIIAWLPYFLTYYPGLISSDAIWMIQQGIGVEPLSNHHPILFTLFMQLVITIGSSFLSLNGAVGLFCVIHMILFAGMLSYITYWLANHNASRELVIITMLYFALNPAIALYSVYLTKDIFFSCFLVIFVLQLYDVINSNGSSLDKRKQFFVFLGLSIGIIFLRNNGLYIVVGAFAILAFLYKKIRGRVILLVLICVGISASVKGPIFSYYEVEKSSFVESVSIPLQQMGYVIKHDGNIKENEEAYLSKLLPFDQVKDVYTPGVTTVYKFHPDFAGEYLDETNNQFLSVWASMLPDNLIMYVEAYLMQTSGYWHIGQTDSISAYGVIENDLGLEQVNFIKDLTGFSIEPLIEKMILAVRKAPIINFVTNMAGMMFGILLFTILGCYRKKGRITIALIPIWILWATLLVAAPAYCKFRYMFVLPLVLPYLGFLSQEILCKGIVEDEK